MACAQGIDLDRKKLELKLSGGKDYRTGKDYPQSMDLRLRLGLSTDDDGKPVLVGFVYDHNDKNFVADWSLMGNEWLIIRSDEGNTKGQLSAKGELNIYTNTEHGPRGFKFKNYEKDGKPFATRIAIDDSSTQKELFCFYAYPQAIGADYAEDPMLYVNWVLLQAEKAGVKLISNN